MDISIIIVSFNTKNLLIDCIESLKKEIENLKNKYPLVKTEIIIVENGSHDGSDLMLKEQYSDLELYFSEVNLGFGEGNNVGMRVAKGEFVVLLNSDAFFVENSLLKSYELMLNNPEVGIGVGKLIGRDQVFQPSKRSFPSVFNDFFKLSGLESKYSDSKIFGRGDYLYESPDLERECDWGPGAFNIIRNKILKEVGLFDDAFFLYYEEVDLAKRIKNAGYKVYYWPQIEVIHIGGESAKSLDIKRVAKSGNQLTLWRLQSQYIYYKKHHGSFTAYCSKFMESSWSKLRILKSSDQAKKDYLKNHIETISEAWNNTKGGKISPPKPWK